ncbi:hypothetical protein CKO27_07835 [Thiocystis violacea]|nr:hypothetical protein [Thiocystis violacea]
MTPVRYLRIQHPAKRLLDVIVPALMAGLATACLMLLPYPVRLLGDSGLISVFTDLLQILVGFYIAALAAVATFDRPGMDAPLDGEPARLIERRNGALVPVNLSRRRFLSMMFGYLSFLGLVLYFWGALAGLLAENLRDTIPVEIYVFAVPACLFLYLFWICNLLVTTLLGLHYLSDRIHR